MARTPACGFKKLSEDLFDHNKNPSRALSALFWCRVCKYSGGDKTSVESLGGDFSINNAFNPRNLGAK